MTELKSCSTRYDVVDKGVAMSLDILGHTFLTPSRMTNLFIYLHVIHSSSKELRGGALVSFPSFVFTTALCGR